MFSENVRNAISSTKTHVELQRGKANLLLVRNPPLPLQINLYFQRLTCRLRLNHIWTVGSFCKPTSLPKLSNLKSFREIFIFNFIRVHVYTFILILYVTLDSVLDIVVIDKWYIYPSTIYSNILSKFQCPYPLIPFYIICHSIR